jgi:peptide/nickel transport system ATP-binding protein
VNVQIADPTDRLLTVEDLQVRFRVPAGEVRAVDGVNLSVSRGRTLGLVGESGSGKSVVSKAIMNILPPNGGVLPASRVRFDGEDLLNLGPATARKMYGPQIAMVFQDPMTSLTPVLTVGKQLTETLRTHLDLSRREARARAIELLKEVGIPDAAGRFDQYPHNFSGGMRQRVTIALALSCRPRLLIADEPTTALDVTVQHQILNLLQSLQESHEMGMILITHDLGVVAGRTDEIAVMYAGRIVERAPTKTLFRGMRHPYTRALFESIPKASQPSHTRLATIPGRPPIVISPPSGCRFAPRCPKAQAKCEVEDPKLRSDAKPEHTFACHFPLEPLEITPRAAAGPSGVTAPALIDDGGL